MSMVMYNIDMGITFCYPLFMSYVLHVGALRNFSDVSFVAINR